MNGLKKAVIAGDHFDKTIYRAIGTFPILYTTIWQYTIDNSMRLQEKLQHAILFDGHGWETEMDSWQRWFMWLLTGYIKAFECIVHQFLIDKLEVCDFTYEVFNIGNYF